MIFRSLLPLFYQKSWVRAAKRHDIDDLGLHYRLGDEFLIQTQGCHE